MLRTMVNAQLNQFGYSRVAVMQSSKQNIQDGRQQTAMSNILEASNYGGSAEQYEVVEDQFTKL